MSNWTKRSVAVIMGIGATVAVGGVAFAWLTATGSGTTSVTMNGSIGEVTSWSSSVEDGDVFTPRTLTIGAANPEGSELRFRSVEISDVVATIPATAVEGGEIPLQDVTLLCNFRVTDPKVVDAGGDPMLIVLPAGGGELAAPPGGTLVPATITADPIAANQDLCQTAEVTFHITAM